MIESRYEAISNKIEELRFPYFVDFGFQNAGIKVAGQTAPIVKMAWASGETLGEFIEGNYSNRDKLKPLRDSLRALAYALEGKNVAHGDIQPGNVMVSNGGQFVQLIDYDGMYVDEIKALGSAELGHRSFQHPKRNEQIWNAQLDRFSFIELNLALSVLETHPEFCQLMLKISLQFANLLLIKYQLSMISLPREKYSSSLNIHLDSKRSGTPTVHWCLRCFGCK